MRWKPSIRNGNWNQFANDWWNKGYFLNRNINLLMTYIPNLDISVEEKDALMGEAHFLRAYTYFGLAKRYGGIHHYEVSGV